MKNTAEILEFPRDSVTHLGITIDLGKDNKLTVQAKKLLKDYYCREDEPSPQYAFARAATAYCYGDLELAQRIYDYVSSGWFMYSSPVLSNAPIAREKVKALPISCIPLNTLLFTPLYRKKPFTVPSTDK